LPTELFRGLIRDVDKLAMGLDSAANACDHEVRVGSHVATCRVDPAARMVTLVAVDRLIGG
jgi:hypothetical protein